MSEQACCWLGSSGCTFHRGHWLADTGWRTQPGPGARGVQCAGSCAGSRTPGPLPVWRHRVLCCSRDATLHNCSLHHCRESSQPATAVAAAVWGVRIEKSTSPGPGHSLRLASTVGPSQRTSTVTFPPSSRLTRTQPTRKIFTSNRNIYHLPTNIPQTPGSEQVGSVTCYMHYNVDGWR